MKNKKFVNYATVVIKAEMAWYAALKAIDYAHIEDLPQDDEGKKAPFIIPFMLYYHNLVLHLHELLKFFDERKNKPLFAKLESTPKQRTKFRKFRNIVAHIGTFDETIAQFNSLDPDNELESIMRDLTIVIIYLQSILKGLNVELKNNFVRELNAITNLFSARRFPKWPE